MYFFLQEAMRRVKITKLESQLVILFTKGVLAVTSKQKVSVLKILNGCTYVFCTQFKAEKLDASRMSHENSRQSEFQKL
jgi:hypothetical protein